VINEKAKLISIAPSETMLVAIKLMDQLDRKSLIVVDSNRFISILSIGDVQRAIIQNLPMNTPIDKILRPKIKVAYSNESKEIIRERMIEFRTECMPVLNEAGDLVEILFWEDEFQVQIKKSNELKDIPVVIMAGGFGSRLKPLTNIIPKPLIPIGDKPIVELIVDGFNELGVSQFYFSVNYKAEMIQYHFDHIENKNYQIDYFKETTPLGTAGSLFLLKGKIKSTFFVSNCDILILQDYAEIFNFHKEKKNEITLVGSLKHTIIPYGILETGEDGQLVSIKEKPEFTHIINSGMYILEPNLLDEIPENSFFHITELIEKVKQRGGRVGVFPVSEKSWFDIGEWNEYQKTLDFFEKKPFRR
jgi:dTDP-glucose pyrophosphorylase